VIAAIGGRGVIGGAIVEALRAHGHEVLIVTHDRQQARVAGYRYGDMLDPQSLDAAIEGAEVVVQSGMFPTYPIEKPKLRHTFMQFDGVGTEHLVAAARRAGVRRYVYISGAGIPASPRIYYQAILRGEHAVQNSGMETVCIRPTLVYGPRDRGLNRILAAAKKLPVLPLVGPGSQLEQPVYVNDVGEVARQAVAPGAPQGVFEIGGPERFTIDEMLLRFFKHVGFRRGIVHIPYRVARFGALLLERLPGPPLTTNAIDFLMEDFIADTGPLLAAFNLRLTPFEEGLSKYLGSAHAS
jgi:nucleoside-diphosphate-sugar epimerase